MATGLGTDSTGALLPEIVVPTKVEEEEDEEEDMEDDEEGEEL